MIEMCLFLLLTLVWDGFGLGLPPLISSFIGFSFFSLFRLRLGALFG